MPGFAKGRAAERQALMNYVFAAQGAIAELRPQEVRARHLPAAMNQIGVIVETTENAANQIMAAVDDMLEAGEAMDSAAYRALVERQCLVILEACAFQDLTGQRIAKIVETLLTLEDRLAGLVAALGEGGEHEAPAPDDAPILLNGPAMPGEGVDQDDIDRLFA